VASVLVGHARRCSPVDVRKFGVLVAAVSSGAFGVAARFDHGRGCVAVGVDVAKGNPVRRRNRRSCLEWRQDPVAVAVEVDVVGYAVLVGVDRVAVSKRPPTEVGDVVASLSSRGFGRRPIGVGVAPSTLSGNPSLSLSRSEIVGIHVGRCR